MYISAFPTLKLRYLTGHVSSDNFFMSFPKDRMSFYYRGANAIYHAVKSLKLGPADNILVPAYNCGIEADAILAAQANVKFFSILETMEYDIQSVERAMDQNTKAIFIIHYFGFPQNIDKLKKICKDKQLYLIEDCAHALFSQFNKTALGAAGDVSIFSFQKTLAVPDGGGLLANNQKLNSPHPTYKPKGLTTLRSLTMARLENIHMFHEFLFQIINWILIKPARFIFRLLKKGSASTWQVTTASTAEFDEANVGCSISDAALNIIKANSREDVFEKRRENFKVLLKGLSGNPKIKSMFSQLPEGVCPLFFPILVENRDQLQGRLKEKGVETFIFGKTPHASIPIQQFPWAQFCSKHNLCLPIHQDIRSHHLDYMIRVIGELVE